MKCVLVDILISRLSSEIEFRSITHCVDSVTINKKKRKKNKRRVEISLLYEIFRYIATSRFYRKIEGRISVSV